MVIQLECAQTTSRRLSSSRVWALQMLYHWIAIPLEYKSKKEREAKAM